jgi:hypothetical protein
LPGDWLGREFVTSAGGRHGEYIILVYREEGKGGMKRESV